MATRFMGRQQGSPWEALLPQMFLMKMRQNHDLAVEDRRLKAEEIRLKARVDEHKRQEGVAADIRKERSEFRPNEFKTEDGTVYVQTSSGQYAQKRTISSADKYKRVWSKSQQAYVQKTDAQIAENPNEYGQAIKTVERLRRAGATPFAEKKALKEIPTPQTDTQKANLDIAKKRVELAEESARIKVQNKAIEAEQLILGYPPDDPRGPATVRQFQQNAGTQPYIYVSKKKRGYWGYGKERPISEKIDLPAHPKTGVQITAKDIMDTLKANPTKYRTPEDVLKALGVM